MPVQKSIFDPVEAAEKEKSIFDPVEPKSIYAQPVKKLPGPQFMTTPRDIRTPEAPEGTRMQIGPAPEPTGFLRKAFGYTSPPKPEGWERASPIEKFMFATKPIEHILTRIGGKIASEMGVVKKEEVQKLTQNELAANLDWYQKTPEAVGWSAEKVAEYVALNQIFKVTGLHKVLSAAGQKLAKPFMATALAAKGGVQTLKTLSRAGIKTLGRKTLASFLRAAPENTAFISSWSALDATMKGRGLKEIGKEAAKGAGWGAAWTAGLSAISNVAATPEIKSAAQRALAALNRKYPRLLDMIGRDVEPELVKGATEAINAKYGTDVRFVDLPAKTQAHIRNTVRAAKAELQKQIRKEAAIKAYWTAGKKAAPTEIAKITPEPPAEAITAEIPPTVAAEPFKALAYRGISEKTPVAEGLAEGTHYTTNKKLAKSFAEDYGRKGELIEKEIALENPLYLTDEMEFGAGELTGITHEEKPEGESFPSFMTRKLVERGYDGIVYNNGEEIIVFDEKATPTPAEPPTGAGKVLPKNERYLAYEKITTSPTNAGYMAFISQMKNKFVKAHPESIGGGGQILDHNAFTKFIQEQAAPTPAKPPDIDKQYNDLIAKWGEEKITDAQGVLSDENEKYIEIEDEFVELDSAGKGETPRANELQNQLFEMVDEHLQAKKKVEKPAPETKDEYRARIREVKAKHPEAQISRRPVTVEGKKYYPIALPTDQIGVDAAKFQFKLGAKLVGGVTEALKGVEKFDPVKGGQILVWQDKAGKYWVVDGHHRVALAKKTGAETLETWVVSEKDGVTEQDARAIGALRNLADGKGTAIDAAKLFRDSDISLDELRKNAVPTNSTVVQQGLDMADLSDEVFRLVIDERLPANMAATIGKHVKNATQQKQVADLILEGEVETLRQAELLAATIDSAPVLTKTEQTLFGLETTEKSLYAERAKVLANVEKKLKLNKKIFGVLATQTGVIEAKGNILAKVENLATKEKAEEVLFMLEKLVNTKGPIAEALNDATKQYAENPTKENLSKVTSELLKKWTEGPGRLRIPERERVPELPLERVAEKIEPKPEKPLPSPAEEVKKAPIKAVDTKRVSQLRKLADTLDKHIEDKRRPMTQNPTPKRMREYYSRIHDADNMERTQRAMNAMADAIEKGELPAELESVRTKQKISSLVYKGLKGGGYYEVIPSDDYSDKTPTGKALQQLIEGKETPEAEAVRVEREKQQAIQVAEEKVRFVKIAGFFPTPKPLAKKMIELADISKGMNVLEPSAGKGDLADVIQEETGVIPDTAEIVPSLQEILKLKKYQVWPDFLEMKLSKPGVEGLDVPYDRIIMNPPFEKGQDIDHVKHAYSLLKPGGRIVSIMSEGSFSRSDKKAMGFREWLESVGGTSEKLTGAFKGIQAFRQTGVSGRIVVIDKLAKPKGKPGFIDVRPLEKSLTTFLKTVEPAKITARAFGKKPGAIIIKGVHQADVGRIEFNEAEIEALDSSLVEFGEKLSRYSNRILKNLMAARGKPVGAAALLVKKEALKALAKEAPGLVGVRKMITRIADHNYKYLQSVVGDDIHYVEDYFYGIYKDPDKVERFLDYWKTTKRFTKEKKLPTVADAIAYGLDLRDYNPVNNLRSEYTAIARLDGMIYMRDELMRTGKGRYIDTKEEAPHDWEKIKEPVFKDVRVHPELAVMIKSLLSTNKLRRGWFPRGLTHINNALRTLKFAFSMFHQLNITKQSIADEGYLKFLQPSATRGITRGFKKSDPIFRTPAYKNYIRHGGGHRYSIESQAIRAVSNFVESLDRRLGMAFKVGALPIRIPKAYVKWLFQSYIPKVKYSKYLDSINQFENKKGRTPTSTEKIEIIKEQQNFYGMMNERLFGRSGTVTSLMRLWYMSPGYFEGNFRTILKSILQWGGKEGYKANRSRSNIINSLILSGIAATTITLILTGKPPKKPENLEDVRDLFKADTGKVDDKGRKIMVDFLTYDKDYWNLLGNVFIGRPDKAAEAAIKRGAGMVAPSAQVALDIANMAAGRALVDWKNDRVTEVTDPLARKVLKIAVHEINRIEPISVSVYGQSRRRDQTAVLSALTALLGVRPTLTEKDKREQEILHRIYSLKGQQEELYQYLAGIRNPRKSVERYNKTVDTILSSPMIPRAMRKEWEPKLVIDLDKYLENRAYYLSQQNRTEREITRAKKILRNFGVTPDQAQEYLDKYWARERKKAPISPLERDRVIGRIRKRKRLEERMQNEIGL